MGEELDKAKHSVRLVEDRVTDVQAAAQSSIQKANTEITYLQEQLAARQSTHCDTQTHTNSDGRRCWK